jgi:hypothetical protein
MQDPRVVTGPVVLAKSPVSHVGDVRRVEAVAPAGWAGQQLAADYVNVVVFSQMGQRPLPNMLAGSDLVRGLRLVASARAEWLCFGCLPCLAVAVEWWVWSHFRHYALCCF